MSFWGKIRKAKNTVEAANQKRRAAAQEREEQRIKDKRQELKKLRLEAQIERQRAIKAKARHQKLENMNKTFFGSNTGGPPAIDFSPPSWPGEGKTKKTKTNNKKNKRQIIINI